MFEGDKHASDGKNKKISSITLLALTWGTCKMRTPQPVTIAGISAKSEKTYNGFVTSSAAKKE